jgi:hypothetical protein
MQKVVSAGIPQGIINGTSSNTAQSLTDLGATIEINTSQPGGGALKRQAQFATVSVETNAVRFACGTPTTANGHLLQPGDSIDLQDVHEIKTAKFISAVAGAHATLQISVEF